MKRPRCTAAVAAERRAEVARLLAEGHPFRFIDQKMGINSRRYSVPAGAPYRVTFSCFYCGVKTKTFSNCCDECNEVRGRAAAIAAVSRAKRRGELPNAKTKLCVDCGAMAHDWDHRDYSKPLDVEPVCRSCNLRRGPAKSAVPIARRSPAPAPSQEAAA